MKFFKSEDKFQYFPATVFPINHGGLCIYVKYKDNKECQVTLVESSSRHCLFRCPDRDLLFASDSNRAYPNRYFDYDEVVDASSCWGNHPDLNTVLMNFTQYVGKEQNSPNFRKQGRPENTPVIMSDSGGYQIQSHQLDYINPKRLVEWYNDNVDIGIVLDIPHTLADWEGLSEKAALAQSKNIDIMLQHKKPELELLNVIHGKDVVAMRKFFDIVDRPEFTRVCVGGNYFESMLQSIHKTISFTQSVRNFDHYHILGVGQINLLLAYMKMAHKGVLPFITTDSSTWLQEGLTMKYYNWMGVNTAPRYIPIGKDTNYPNSRKRLSCSCPICSAVKYQDIFACYQHNIIGYFLSMHNQFAFNSYLKSMYQIVGEASSQELKDLVKAQFSTRTAKIDETLASFDFIDKVSSSSVDLATRHFSMYLNTASTEESSNSSIFSGLPHLMSQEDYDLMQESGVDDYDEWQAYSRNRLNNILDNYIGIDIREKSIIKNTKKDKKPKKGHDIHTSGTVVRPGKKAKKPVKAKVDKNGSKKNIG